MSEQTQVTMVAFVALTSLVLIGLLRGVDSEDEVVMMVGLGAFFLALIVAAMHASGGDRW